MKSGRFAIFAVVAALAIFCFWYWGEFGSSNYDDSDRIYNVRVLDFTVGEDGSYLRVKTDLDKPLDRIEFERNSGSITVSFYPETKKSESPMGMVSEFDIPIEEGDSYIYFYENESYAVKGVLWIDSETEQWIKG